MAIIFTQTDQATSCGAQQMCASGTVAASPLDIRMVQGADPGGAQQTFDIPSSSSELVAFFESEDVGKQTWEGGTWTVRINITDAQSDLTVENIWICRVDTNCTAQASVANTNFSRSIANTGVQTFDLQASETTGDASDHAYIVVEVANAHSHSSRTVGITADQDVDSPIAEPETVTVQTDPATDVDHESATLNGEVTELSGADSADASFEWRETGASSWTSTTAQTVSSTGTYSETISGLAEQTDYEYRAVVDGTNDSDTGTTSTFTTDASTTTTTIAGDVVFADTGTAAEGATVVVVDSTTDETVAELTTDANGAFSGDVPGDGPFQAAAQFYDDTDDQAYNAPSYPGLTPLPEPVGSPTHWWPLVEGSGTAAVDEAGSADGTIHGATWLTGTDTWVGDHALSGDGADDYVDTGPADDVTGGFCIAATVTHYFTDGTVGDTDQSIITSGYDSDAGATSWEFRFTYQDELSINSWDGSSHGVSYPISNLDAGTKYRCIGQYDAGASEWQLWINGVLEATASDTTGATGGTNNRCLFAHDSGSPGNFLEADLDDVIFYEYALTDQEIQDDYNRQPWI